MKIELTPQQCERRAAFRAFVDKHIVPVAQQVDRDECVPRSLICEVARQGYLGANVPAKFGGTGMDMITFGILHEEFGRGCSSMRSLLTVHSMVAFALMRFGSVALQQRWLPKLARGEVIGAFALTEPEAGSDAASITSTACPITDVDGYGNGDGFVLTGCKRWITFGQLADVFLTFAKLNGTTAMFLVPRDTPRLTVIPINGMSGTRGSMLAELRFDGCRLPADCLVQKPSLVSGASLSTVLDLGRYSVACGSVGIAQACLEASVQHAYQRKQFGVLLNEHQLIGRMLTDMMTNIRAARLLCYQAGYLKTIGDPRAPVETLVAKYFASTAAVKIANDAIQIHGAIGLSESLPLHRYLRDSKVAEIIEGSTQIQQLLIAQHAMLDV